MCVCRLLLRHCQTSLPRYVNSSRRLYAWPHSQLTADICSQHAWRQMQDCPSMEPRRPMSFYGTSLQRLHLRCCRAPSATTGAMAQTAAGQPPGVPGTQTVRTQGNPQPVAPLHSDPVGPASKLFPHPSYQPACVMAFNPAAEELRAGGISGVLKDLGGCRCCYRTRQGSHRL